MLRGWTGHLLSLALLSILNLGVVAADAPVNLQPRPVALSTKRLPPKLRIDTSLVLVPVSVTDRLNHPVMGLDRSNFRIFDGSAEQQILNLSYEDAPLTVGIVFDTSGSMDRKMDKSRAAVAELLRAANPEDEFFLVEFSDRPRLTQSFTAEAGDILTPLAQTVPSGQTSLLDAIALGLSELKKSVKPRKALVILSDGGDNRSRYTEREICGMVRESDATIYAMGIFETSGAHLSAEEIAGPALLSEVTEASGGRLFTVGNLNALPPAAARIGVELHNQYVLGYAPNNLRADGKHHKVRVKVLPPEGIPPLHVDWRAGYRAPAE